MLVYSVNKHRANPASRQKRHIRHEIPGKLVLQSIRTLYSHDERRFLVITDRNLIKRVSIGFSLLICFRT